MAGPINGREIIIKIKRDDDSFGYIHGQTNASIQGQAAEIDASSKDSTESVFLPGRSSDSLSLDFLYIPADPEQALLKRAKRLAQTVTLMRTELGEDYESADAVITGHNETFPDNAPATVQVTFRIASPWTGV